MATYRIARKAGNQWRILPDEVQPGEGEELWLGDPSELNVPVAPVTAAHYVESQGFEVFALLDLKDMEDTLRAASVEIPPKAASVRTWVDAVRLAFATQQTPEPAPHTYQEVQAEVLAILNP